MLTWDALSERSAPADIELGTYRVSGNSWVRGTRTGAILAHEDSPVAGEHALGAEPAQLFRGEVWCGRAVGPQHPVPRQVVPILGEDFAYQPGPAWYAGLVCRPGPRRLHR